MNPVTAQEVRRAVSRHRALLAGGLAAGAVASALTVLTPQPAEGVVVLTAARDLEAGSALVLTDLRSVEMPRGLVPTGALLSTTTTVGRVLAAPVRRGEALTDLRLAGAALLGARTSGLVAVPVRIADAASAALVTAGDRVDVLAASAAAAGGSAAHVVAADAEVLAVPAAVADSGDGALIVVATTPPVAATLAAAAVSSRLSLTLRPRP